MSERTQQLVAKGAARSRNSLIVAALESYVDRLEPEAIDAQIAPMVTDKKHKQLTLTVAEEFAESDRETLGEATHAAR